jgi:ornithine decarboxylase
MEAKFVLSKKILLEQVEKLADLNLKVSYSYKTNREVGNVLQDISDVDFSVHAKEELEMIKDKSKIWFFIQAEYEKELKEILGKGVRNFVVDNEIDLERILNVIDSEKIKTNISLRMKFQEHRIGSGKYFVYGMASKKINEIILKLKDNEFIDQLGIHLHRKSQNTSEWEIKSELKDSLEKESLERINFVNLGGGLPTKYRGYTNNLWNYISEKLEDARIFLEDFEIETYIEPGRFLAGPCIKLETEIIQIQENNLILNTTIYNCALDTILTGTKMLVEGELEAGDNFYLIKGNSPTRDDIFRYNVGLENPKIGDKIVFLNAGAYNYTTDFFGYKKLETEIKEDFENAN